MVSALDLLWLRVRVQSYHLNPKTPKPQTVGMGLVQGLGSRVLEIDGLRVARRWFLFALGFGVLGFWLLGFPVLVCRGFKVLGLRGFIGHCNLGLHGYMTILIKPQNYKRKQL